MVFGAPGAIAGMDGKKKIVYKCPDCGLTLDHPMDTEIMFAINMASTSERLRKTITIGGTPISWEVLKNRYNNIEDEISVPAALEKPIVNGNTVFLHGKSYEKLDTSELEKTLSEEERNENKKLYKAACIAYNEACQNRSIECEKIQKIRDQEISRRFQNTIEKKKTDALLEKENGIKTSEQRKNMYNLRFKKAQDALPTLGFFQFSAKSSIKKEIAYCESMIALENKNIENYKQNYVDELKKIDVSKDQIEKEIAQSVNKEYPLPAELHIELFFNETRFKYTANGTISRHYIASLRALDLLRQYGEWIKKCDYKNLDEVTMYLLYEKVYDDGSLSPLDTALRYLEIHGKVGYRHYGWYKYI